MKKYLQGLLLALCIVPFTAVKATHYAGVEITYEHLGNNSYAIFLTIILDDCSTCAGPAPMEEVCITSSCISNSIDLDMPQIPHPTFRNITPNGDTLLVFPGDTVPESNDCAKPNFGSTIGRAELFRVYAYSDTVVLGPCADWRITFDACCRNQAITNGASNQGTYVEAILNNLIGPNTSPQFLKPGLKRFCVIPNPNDPAAKPFNWDHPSIEPDGDSIYYKFSQPQEAGGSGNGCALGVDIPWAAGFSTNAPMTTANGISIDRKFGFFTFMPTQPEVDVVKIDVEEYRFNTTQLRWQLIGRVSRDMQIPIDGTCLNSVEDGPKIISSGFGFGTESITKDSLEDVLSEFIGGTSTFEINNDSIPNVSPAVYTVPIVPYTCGNSEIELRFDVDIFCPTIDPTDFRLMGPDGISRPIVNVESGCTQILRETRLLKLELFQPLDVNGNYLLQIKRGNDGNTLENKCGFQLVDNYFMILKVSDCPELDYQIGNVTVVEDEMIKVEFDLDPLSYFSNTFNRINVLRANNDQAFIKVGEITDQTVREYIDSTVDGFAVDNQIYQYLLQMITNSNPRIPTNFINSIVLSGDSINDTQMELAWNPYDNGTYGAPAEYEVFEGQYDTTAGSMNWTSLQVVGSNLTYIYTMPDPEQRPGQFWLKVEGSDPSGTNLRISESNWITLGVPEPPIPPVTNPVVNYVPNVITPNGDMLNDRFYFQLLPLDPSLREYSNLSLSIFNRWGKQVFFDDNFMDRNTETDGWDGTDQNTGQRLADGVYFYVAKFNDMETGKSEELSGSVTLAGGI